MNSIRQSALQQQWNFWSTTIMVNQSWMTQFWWGETTPELFMLHWIVSSNRCYGGNDIGPKPKLIHFPTAKLFVPLFVISKYLLSYSTKIANCYKKYNTRSSYFGKSFTAWKYTTSYSYFHTTFEKTINGNILIHLLAPFFISPF